VGHAIYPDPQPTTGLEPFKTAPQSEVNLLQKIASFIGVQFIGSDKPVESVTVICCRLVVQVVPLLPHTYR
jgi:hypothetical protein